MTIEQLPFGADFDGLVLLRPEDLIVAAGEGWIEAAIGRAGAVELSTDRVCRSRIGHIDAAVRQRFEREPEIEVGDQEFRGLLAERAIRGITGCLDAVIVVAETAIEDQEVMIVRAIHDIAADRIDTDLG